ncbi:tyrosine protein phosphatase 1 [Ophidiomyces ophidiicola]|uniref:Tyrosine protein phosphatase 1 n=1 Tax=Ophidiomyces ophidiicola TaxID=1387563 RepID=A0ACB8UUM2_9EURO|nr:tyrosine protein phosphatase 1 [Ophidiomyces ophidiicola]KAI1931333.1 tyrosine protein phosphatase 1 [Ophidiomyces ophidiicola]KAI1950002.1 tyrosine protein phosphatase 1 [Ophidiomyces ophidiicola]KAI1967889.1 tyrosine protein phosphatase 1 [Ophidiomyces ophidiicola]KAI2034781.1 tyrosine protein phosphatase 1 [Ophidiomyces ophidiicola]
MTEMHFPQTLGKRERSSDSRSSVKGGSVTALDVSSRESSTERGGAPSIPAFLSQSPSELRDKFEDLQWAQRARMTSAVMSGNPSHPFALESGPVITERSRYANVQAWANSRIHLKVPPGDCDFINASPIILKDSKTEEAFRYIATQGPKENHLAHFWNMVFHETGEVAIIVMLTQTLEAGKEKCAQYFPLDLEVPTFTFSHTESDPFIDCKEGESDCENVTGSITLLTYSYDEICCSEIRQLKLDVGSKSKIVWHYLFAGWSDYSKPEGQYRDALIQLTKITAEQAVSADNPRVVHCSAGVGRTGTFIALDHLLRQLHNGSLLDVADDADMIFRTVDDLREQRMMMVFNEIQYQFLYDVLREQAQTLRAEKVSTEAPTVSENKTETVPEAECSS